MSIRHFVFFNILYPLFEDQFDEMFNAYRLGLIYSVEISEQGLVYVRVNKGYPVGSTVTLFDTGDPLYDEETKEYLGNVEEVYARGKVVELSGNTSKILLINQEKEVKLGLRSKRDGCLSEFIGYNG